MKQALSAANGRVYGASFQRLQEPLGLNQWGHPLVLSPSPRSCSGLASSLA